MRIYHLLLGLFLVSGSAVADQIDEVVRLHAEAVGGKARLAEFKAMRATGYVLSGGKRLRFSLTAARPDRIRLETENEGRTLVQATDGVEPAWEFDTGTWPPRYQTMRATVAKAFVADAEFDDPLVSGASRGYAFESAGETSVQGRRLRRVLVTRNLQETFSLLLDPETYLIVLRVENRTSAAGRALQVVTRYDDYRSVKGILLPHRVTVVTEGGVEQQTIIEKIDANPPLTAETFSRPKVAGSGQK